MKNLHLYLEHTLLKADIRQSEIEELIILAKKHQFRGVCIPPFWVKKVKRELMKTNIQTVTVIGFPLGHSTTETKVFETQQAIKNGADELDVVWSLTAFKSGMNWPKIEIAKLASLCHEQEKIIKIIIETSFLNDEELIQACDICTDSGADFVKTSTGFSGEGAQVATVQLMRSQLPSQVGIKASGGINTFAKAVEMIRAGADRIGTSSGNLIMAGA
ncbi:MAG: deoxyribose-phosphate aldolase [Cyclobacteriaceae bacterium]